MTPPRSQDPEPAPVAVAERLRALADALEHEPAVVSAATLGAVTCELVACSNLLDAVTTHWLGTFDARRIWTADGARSAGGWVAARTEIGKAGADTIVKRARALRRWSQVEIAYDAGRLGTSKVRMLLEAADAFPKPFARDEAVLVAQVTPLTVTQAYWIIKHWRALAEAEQESNSDDPPPDPADRNRLAWVVAPDGRTLGSFDLDPVAGEQFRNEIAAHIDRLFNQGSYQADDGHSLGWRRAQAMCELIDRGSGAGTHRGRPRPSVSLMIDHRTLGGEPTDGLDDVLTRWFQTEGGAPVTRSTAERLLCTADLTAILTKMREDGAIETLGITNFEPLFKGKQRTAIELRDKGCDFPGCAAPPGECEAHHIEPRRLGPTTTVDKGRLYCSCHHHLLHEGGWKARFGDDGEVHIFDPDGRELPRAPHGTRLPPPGGPPAEPPDG